MAIADKSIDIFKLLMQNEKIDVNTLYKSEKEEKTALHMAIADKNILKVKLLMQNKNIDVNIKYINTKYALKKRKCL